jgi:RNA polymerase sigma-70 factor (ECF subfamily)
MNKTVYLTLTDDALLSAFRSGDIAAYEEIYKRYWPILYGIALKQTSSKQDAEELVQNVFERNWKNRETIVIKNIGAYLTVSLRNIIIDFFRQKNVEKRFQDNQDFEEDANLTEDEVNRVQLLNLMDNLLQQLPEKTQIVFKLSRYEGKSIKDIAELMGLTDKAVEYHITQSIKHLKKFLKHYLAIFFLLYH